MALPSVKTLEEYAKFSETVVPYLPQLYELPAKIIENISSRDGLANLYVETNPLISAFAFSLFLGFIFFIASEVTKNYSQVDRFWSILPNIYVLHIAFWAWLSGVPHTRIALVAVFTTIWSVRCLIFVRTGRVMLTRLLQCRLTFNYWRKGGYERGVEDYRWYVVTFTRLSNRSRF